MGTEMGVHFPAKGRASELDGELVRRWLRPLFPELELPTEDRPEVEQTHEGSRIFSQWSLYAGKRGIRLVHLEMWDNDRAAPREEFAAELPTLVDPMQGLARASGARFIVEGEDVTDASLEEIRSLIM